MARATYTIEIEVTAHAWNEDGAESATPPTYAEVKGHVQACVETVESQGLIPEITVTQVNGIAIPSLSEYGSTGWSA